MSNPSSTTTRTRTATGTDQTKQSNPKLTLSPIQVAASALASVTAAIVASYFGVTGTIVGTAVVSVASTVGGALYAHSLRRGKERLAQARVWTQGSTFPFLSSDPTRPSSATRAIPQTPTDEAAAEEPTRVVPSGRLPAPPVGPSRRPSWLDRMRRRKLPLVGALVATFVAAMAVVTMIEAATGAPLAHTIGGSGSDSGFTLGGGSSGSKGTTTTVPTTASPTTLSPTTTSGGSRSTTPATSPTTAPRTTTTTAPRSTSTTTAPTSTTTTPGGASRGAGASNGNSGANSGGNSGR